MIRKTPDIDIAVTIHSDTVEAALAKLVQCHPKRDYVDTDCGKLESIVLVIVPAQTIEFHAVRTLTFPGWLSTEVVRDTHVGRVVFHIEADLVSVVRAEHDLFKVTYRVTQG